MSKRDMSHDEYEEQQFYYRYNMMDPFELQKKFDNKLIVNSIEEEKRRIKLEDLKVKLFNVIREKYIDNDTIKCLTKSQKEAIQLFLKGKRQEHSGVILDITQVAVHGRLEAAKKRLKKICAQDKDIISILSEMSKV